MSDHETGPGPGPETDHESDRDRAAASEQDASSSGPVSESDMSGEGGGAQVDHLLEGIFSEGFRNGEGESGIERIVRAGFVSYERLPILESIFERLIRIMSATLRNMTNENVEVTIDSIRAMRFGDCMNAVPSSSLFAVFKAVPWGNYGIAIVDSRLAYATIDILMGASKIVPQGSADGESGNNAWAEPEEAGGRAHTPIERALIEKLVEMVLGDLSVAFSPVCDVSFAFERLEASSRFVAIARSSHAVVLARFHIDMDERSGTMDLLIPYATLEPVRDQLSQQFMGENLGNDTIWETHLIHEILGTDVDISAVLEETVIDLGALLALSPGARIDFPRKGNESIGVQLRCGQIALFDGRLGQLRGHAAVKIEDCLFSGGRAGDRAD